MRLAFAVKGDPRKDAHLAETIWRDAEYRSEAEHIDALLKLNSLGVPRQQLWQDAGYTPAQIERFEVMAAQDLLDAQMRADLGIHSLAQGPANADSDGSDTPPESGASRRAIAQSPGASER